MGERLISRGEREALSSGPCFFQSCVLAEAVRKEELGLLTAAHSGDTPAIRAFPPPFLLLILSDKQQTIMSIRGQTWRSKDLEFGVACLVCYLGSWEGRLEADTPMGHRPPEDLEVLSVKPRSASPTGITELIWTESQF